MSLRDCIDDMSAQHDSYRKSCYNEQMTRIHYHITSCMVHFCDTPLWFHGDQLPRRVREKDIDALDFSLGQWKTWMTIFFEVTIQYQVTFPSDESFVWEIEQLPEPIEEDAQGEVITYLQDIQAPFHSFISNIRNFWGTWPRQGSSTPVNGPLWQNDERYRTTKIYGKYRECRNHLLLTFARKRGIVPSSFFTTDLVRSGDHPIGVGGYADVWKGYRATDSDKGDSQQIFALKVLKDFTFSRAPQSGLIKALYREAIIWNFMDHPNILRFVGLCRVNDERLQTRVALVSPWMRNGNLLTYVVNHDGIDRSRLLAQVAHGLIYLHSIDIIHGDLKCANVLISEDGTAQLADFGLSSVGDSVAQLGGSVSNSAGNPRWLAPELLFPDHFGSSGKSTRETDVYAFGMTALELFSGKVPFYNLPDPAIPLEVAIKGLKPPRPELATSRGLTDIIWDIVERCWHRDPLLRPKTQCPDSILVEFAATSVVALRVDYHLPGATSSTNLTGLVYEELIFSAKKGRLRKAMMVKFEESAFQNATHSAPKRWQICSESGVKKCPYARTTSPPKSFVVCRVVNNYANWEKHANIVVDDGTARLFDYALPSRARPNAYRNTFEIRVFRAPEIHHEGLSRKSDIYSLAMTFYEILTENLPFNNTSFSDIELFKRIEENSLRPPYPNSEAEQRGLSVGLWAIITQCWASDATARPTAREVSNRLRQLADNEEKRSDRRAQAASVLAYQNLNINVAQRTVRQAFKLWRAVTTWLFNELESRF
ncbi:kinase-like protein [Schizopora paradoxa]|uniref:Kinase-like protein n=1 Tax=Schizopora paradoxa TaxID=27342 RepID=A0A0H2SBA7_9AGAM|nr:kinase-like protein [Schizopora paradoxa]